ncbi:MAG: M48 family metalloprotease [Polyangiaceae bacterium]
MAKKSRRTTGPIKTSLNLGLVVFDGDRDMRAALLADPDFAEVAKEYAERPTQISVRRDLLLTSVRLTPRIAPALFACVDECTRHLGIENDIEVYCSQEAEMNAFVVPPEKGRICIGFSNTALERFSDDELRFILGHELGHALFEHHVLGYDIVENEERISPLQVMQFYSWNATPSCRVISGAIVLPRFQDCGAHVFQAHEWAV